MCECVRGCAAQGVCSIPGQSQPRKASGLTRTRCNHSRLLQAILSSIAAPTAIYNSFASLPINPEVPSTTPNIHSSSCSASPASPLLYTNSCQPPIYRATLCLALIPTALAYQQAHNRISSIPKVLPTPLALL